MLFSTLDGSHVDIKQESLDILKMSLRGKTLFPGTPGYDESCFLWNGMINRKPALVIRPIGTTDVIACVKFARENNIILCLRGGGHNIAGLAVAEGGLMLDMTLNRGVWVDTQNKIAHVQAGCLLADVDSETQMYGLATVLGFVSQTGVAGLTLGGGFGYLTRRFGWTVDNVLKFELVTADGKLICADKDENAELFWALCGGGGNFGVVTRIDFKLHDVGPEVIGGLIAWSASNAPKVLEMYRRLSESAPEELTLVTLMRPAPPAPWIAKEEHGKPMIGILACYSGHPDEGEKILAPIISFGKPIGNILVKRPYAQMQALLDATQPKGRRYYWKSEYLAEVKPELCKKIMQHAATITSPNSAVIVFQLGGALKKLQDDLPVGNRDAGYLFNVTSAWDNPDDDARNIEWTVKVYKDLKQFSTGGAYVNFLNYDEGSESNKAAFGKQYKRLAEVKAKWDPDNFFRTNRNIIPANMQSAVGSKELEN